MKLRHDWLGEIEIPDRPARVVSLAPSVTDTLFFLGLGERVVGRSAFCWRPAEAERLPVVASYTKVRWELLAKLAPELVFTTTGVQRELTEALRERGYAVWPVPLPNTPYGIIENVGMVGALMGVDAAPYQAELARRYGELYRVFSGERIYFEFDLGGPITIGRGSYLNAAFLHLGLKPLFKDRPEAYFPPPLEEVPRLSPDLVVLEPKRVRNREKQLENARRLLAARGWDYPHVVTRGDELAHFGPEFFDYLETFAQEARAALKAQGA